MDQKLARQLMRGLGAEEKNQPLASSPEKKKRLSPQKLASQWQERERMKAPKKGPSPGGEGSSRSRFDVSGSRRIEGTSSDTSIQPSSVLLSASAAPSSAQNLTPATQGSSQVSGGSQVSQGRGQEGGGVAQSEWGGMLAAIAPGLAAAPGEGREASSGPDTPQEAAPAASGGGATRVEAQGDVEGEDIDEDDAPKTPLWSKAAQLCAVILLAIVLGLSAFNPCTENAAWVAVRLGSLGGGVGGAFPSAADVCSSAPAKLWTKTCAATRGLWDPPVVPLTASQSRLSSVPVPEISQQAWGFILAGSQKLSPASKASVKAITAAWSSASSVAQSSWAAVSQSGLQSFWSGLLAPGPAGSPTQELEDWESKVKSSVVVLQGDPKAAPAIKQPAKEEALLKAAMEASVAASAEVGAKEKPEVSGNKTEEEEKQAAATVADPLANLYKSLRQKLGPSAALQMPSQAIQLENASIEDPGTALIPEAPVSFLTQATPVALALTLVLVLASACLGRLLGGPKGAGQTAGQPPAGGATSAPEDVAETQEGGAEDQMLSAPSTPPPDSSAPAPGSSAPEPPTQPPAEPSTPQAGRTEAYRHFDSTSNSNSTSSSKGFGKSVPAFVTPQGRRAGHAEPSSDSLRTGSVSMAGSEDNSETVSSTSKLVTKGDVMMMSTMSSVPAYGSRSAYKASKEEEDLGTPVRRSARLLNKASQSPLPAHSPYVVR